MGDDPMEFFWPDVGRLKVKPIGERAAVLRYFPSEEAIAKGLLLATGRLQEPQKGPECKWEEEGKSEPPG